MFTSRVTLAALVLAGRLVMPTAAFAQPQAAPPSATYEVPPPGVTQELVLADGTRMYGRIERVDGSTIYFRTIADALIETDVSRVKKLTPVEGRSVNGTFQPADPNPTRLFFGPTGRSLPKGSGYLGVYEIFLPFVQVGVTDRVSIGGGTPLFFGSGSEHPFWFTPKVQILNAGRTQAAIGVMHFLNVDDGRFGVAYGAVTHGTSDTAITVAGGFVYDRSFDATTTAGVVMIGGERRVSRRVKLITENYAFSDGGILSFGVRFMGERLSADLGMVMPVGIDETIVFPIVNVVWQFK